MITYKYKKQLFINHLTAIILTITSLNGFSQIFNGGQNPPSVKFDQINTSKFQIIYPTLLEGDAQRLANTLEKIIVEVSASLDRSPRPISIILQNQGVSSNGFVQMAPRRAELYTIPAQEFDAQDWLNSLAVHELRHVVQYDKLSTALTAPLFEELKLALFGINLPAWFFEGDAVITETLLSPAGRGRQPAFGLVFRTNILNKKTYSYSKNYLGSYKDFTPGYYSLGYFMTSKIRRDFEADILDKTLSRISDFPLRPYSFSSSLKKFGGYGTHQLFKNTISELDSLWQDQSKKIAPKSYKVINQENSKIPTNYLLPYEISQNEYLCLKTSFSKTPEITIVTKNGERKILSIGSQTEPNLHYSNNKIVWDEYRSDYRFSKRSFNVICIYDLSNSKFKQLTNKSRYFSPALSTDGKKIIAVKVSLQNRFNLVELNSETGEEIKIYANENNFTLQTPKFNDDGKKIIVTAVNQEGITLLLYDTNSGSYEKLFDAERQLISRPGFHGDEIIYKAHYNGIDNIYSFDLKTRERYQLTSVRFGAFNPSIKAKSNLLLFNDYQAQGQNITAINLNHTERLSLSKTSDNTLEYFEPLKTHENNPDIFTNIPQVKYEAKPYKEATHLFYFHSIRPVFSFDDFINDYNIGFNLASDNKLNTLSSQIGYNYNSSLNSNEFNAGFTYQKFYPIFNVSYENIERLSYAKDTINGQNSFFDFRWRESKTDFRILFPFFSNKLNKTFSSGLQISTSYTNRYNFSVSNLKIIKTIPFPIKYIFYLQYNSSKSFRDLAPKWGANFNISYQHLPFDATRTGNISLFKSVFYTPGLYINHSFKANFNLQNNNGVYSPNIDIPRASGYAHLTPLSKLYNSLLLSYKLPLMYPDWEIGPLAYIKRLKGGIFSDFENINKGSGLRSYGLELSADMNLLRFYLPNFEFNTKIILPTEKSFAKKPIFELGFNFNF